MLHVLPLVGKWNNLFTATLKLTNTDNNPIAITDVFGEYKGQGMIVARLLWAHPLLFACLLTCLLVPSPPFSNIRSLIYFPLLTTGYLPCPTHLHADGQWTRCHAASIGQYRDVSNFSLDPVSTISLDIKLAIQFGGAYHNTSEVAYTLMAVWFL